MGGYDDEAAAASQSGTVLRDSYSRLLEFGIRTVRENAEWPAVDKPAGLDLSALEERARMAKDLGVQVVWTLLCRRWPRDIAFLSAGFVERFSRYASTIAERVAGFDSHTVPIFAPVNEISFLAWSLLSSGEIRRADGTRPDFPEIKRQLVRACIAASDAILAKVPHARLLHTDPLEHVVAPLDKFALERGAELRNELQFEAWDWIAGRDARDLGGHSRYLDLVGANYYAENQWELGSGKRLGWQIDDARRLPLSALLKSLHSRYQRPVAIAETSHCGMRRGAWIREIAAEVREARRLGVRIDGICLHPLIDHLDREHPGRWLLRGLWEVRHERGDKRLEVSAPYAAALRAAQNITGASVDAGTMSAAAAPASSV